MVSKVEVAHALDVQAAFKQAMDLADKDAGDDHDAVKWAIVEIVNRLRDEGYNQGESFKVAQECVDEVFAFIRELDGTPIPPPHTMLN